MNPYVRRGDAVLERQQRVEVHLPDGREVRHHLGDPLDDLGDAPKVCALPVARAFENRRGFGLAPLSLAPVVVCFTLLRQNGLSWLVEGGAAVL